MASSALRAVVDTNIFVSGTILSRGTPFEVLEAWRRQGYFLVCALEAQADCIVSGDPHLRNLKRYQGIDILSPYAFLERLSRLVTP